MNSEFECRKKTSLEDPSQSSEKGCQDLSKFHVNIVQGEKKRNCYGNYFNEKKHSVSGLHIILSRKLLMSQRGVNGSFDGKLCTSVEAYL